MKRPLLALALALLPAAAGAQEGSDTIRLRRVVVTATRLATPARDIAGSVTVITADELAARGVRTVAEALRSVPGIALAPGGGPGSITSLFMRGGESDYVQVLVDGVQMNLPGGAFNWAHLRTEDIERIEIVRGPVSVLYGSDAVAGVVQVFTRAGGAPRLAISAAGSRGARPRDATGDHDDHAFDAVMSGTIRAGSHQLQYGLTAVRAGSTGLYDINSDYDNTQLSGRLRAVGARSDVALTLRHSDNEFHYPTTGAGVVRDRNQVATGDARTVALDAGVALSRYLELRVLGTVNDTDARTDNPDDGTDESSFWSTSGSVRRGAEARINATLLRGLIATLGVEREWQDDETAFESTSSFGVFRDSTDNSRTNTGFLAQLHGSPVRALTATIGARIDDNEQFGTFTTGRAGVSWRPSSNARVHAAIGTAFKEPTFFESYAVGFARGNPDLQPEETRSWEAGTEFATGRVTLGATWFDQRFRNLIQYTGTPAPDQPNYSNIGRASSRGLELTLTTTLARVTVGGHYTFTRARTLDEGFGEDPAFEEGTPLLRRPEHQAAVNALIRINPSLRVTADARFAGERDDLDFTDPAVFSGRRIALPSYTAVDLGMGYGTVRYGRADIDVNVRVRNLFDSEYEEIYNFPAARRTLELAVRAGIDM